MAPADEEAGMNSMEEMGTGSGAGICGGMASLCAGRVPIPPCSGRHPERPAGLGATAQTSAEQPPGELSLEVAVEKSQSELGEVGPKAPHPVVHPPAGYPWRWQ